MSIIENSIRARSMGRLRKAAARNGLLTMAAFGVCGLALFMAVLGSLIAPQDPTKVDTLAVFARPSGQHWLGTDDLGRDIASRLLAGARLSLAGPLCVVLISISVATLLALIAAWNGRRVDSAVSRFLELLFCFPGLILAVVAAAIFGAGLLAPVLALALAYVPVLARVIRAAALRETSLPYVAALKVQGESGWSICLRHLLPNLMPLIVVQATIGFGYALIDLAAISYLGLGSQPPTPDWGVMVADGQSAILQGNPQQALYAALIVVVVVVAVNLVGEKLADRFNVGATL